jgi:hypothetical protein
LFKFGPGEVVKLCRAFFTGLVFLPFISKKEIMRLLNTLLIIWMALLVSGCEVIGDIFGAGVYVGMFIVIFVIVLIIFLVRKIFRR